MIDQTFKKFKGRFFFCSMLILNDNDEFPDRYSFDKYCMSLVEIKDFNALIENYSY